MRVVRRGGSRRVRTGDRGASLIEFALVMPFLLLLIFGLIEFAWLFSQNLDVRHGAREGARIAAVNFPIGPTNPPPASRTTTQTDQIVAEICDRMDIASNVEVTLTSSGVVGTTATATVEAPVDTLTGFLDWAIPSSMTLASSVDIRLEQPAGWADTTAQDCP